MCGLAEVSDDKRRLAMERAERMAKRETQIERGGRTTSVLQR